LAFSRTYPGLHGDLALGLSVAAALPSLALLRSPGGWYRRAARMGSEISFSLYLFHYPFLLLLVFSLFAPDRYEPEPLGIFVFLLVVVASICWAGLWWYLFERNTYRVYQVVRSAMGIGAREARGAESSA
jgi:peptidoglycan/LPS O-acetylase OafA/YrhL